MTASNELSSSSCSFMITGLSKTISTPTETKHKTNLEKRFPGGREMKCEERVILQKGDPNPRSSQEDSRSCFPTLPS